MGQRLRTLRRERGLSQVELSERIGMTQSNISAIERGARGVTIHQVVKIAKALHASTDEILLGVKPGKQKTNGNIKDRRFLRRLQQIDSLPKRKKQALLTTIDAYLSGE